MNNQAKIKLEKIKKLKLPEKVRATADKIEKGLSSADEATQKKAEDALNKLYEQIKAVAAKQREEKTEKEVNEKTIVPQNADIAAPEAKKELTKKATDADDIIDKALKNDPELAGFGKSDKRRDAGRKAQPAGRRVARKGWKNQYGKSDGGRVYYENRENRTDRKSPSFKSGYPYLAKGGKIHPMDDEDGTFYVNLYKTKGDQIVSVDEREYNSKASAMTYAMMKRDFMKVGESIFVMNEDGDVLYTSIGTKKMAMGGKFAWQNAQVGDSARVILENKMGTVMATYGRRFHLKFPDGTEKTYSAEELEFYPEEEYAKGGNIYASDEMYEVKMVSDGIELDSKLIRARNKKEAREIFEDMYREKYEDEFGPFDLQIDVAESKMAQGGYMAKGGKIDESTQMVLNENKAIAHHTKELKKALAKNTKVEPWVVAKIERASTDISDVTHYLEGRSEYAKGGMTEDSRNKYDVVYNSYNQETGEEIAKGESVFVMANSISEAKNKALTMLEEGSSDEEFTIVRANVMMAKGGDIQSQTFVVKNSDGKIVLKTKSLNKASDYHGLVGRDTHTVETIDGRILSASGGYLEHRGTITDDSLESILKSDFPKSNYQLDYNEINGHSIYGQKEVIQTIQKHLLNEYGITSEYVKEGLGLPFLRVNSQFVDKYAQGGYMAEGENYEYVNTFKRFDSNVPVPQEDFEKLVDAYHKQLSGDKLAVSKYKVLKLQMGNYLGHKTVEEMEEYIEKTHNAHKMADGGIIGSGKNGYVAFFKGKRIEVYADSMYGAQKTAAQHFKAKRESDVNVVLAEVDGKPYIQSTAFATGGYVSKRDIEAITIVNPNKSNPKNPYLTFRSGEFLNGLNQFSKGGKLTDNYTYIKRSDVFAVYYKDKSKKYFSVMENKPKNGFWVSKKALIREGGKTPSGPNAPFDAYETYEEFAKLNEKVWDKLKIQSGSEIYSSDSLQKKLAVEYPNSGIDAKFKSLKAVQRKKVAEIMTDENEHSLRNYLTLRGYLGQKEYAEYESIFDPKRRYVLNPANFKNYTADKVKVGSILTTNTGIKVKVVEYNPQFGVKTLRLDATEADKPSQYLKLSKFNGFEEMGEGGKIGFEALSKKVASRYEGKKVKPKYQSEYGKTYNAEEAKEVGDKVASKVYRMQQGKMAKGGELEKGIMTEMKEHGMSREEATKTAQDHLKEDSKYYTKMAKIGLKKGGKIALPHELDRYFTKPKGTIEVEISKLIPIRARKSGIENAEVYMKKAYDGEMAKRKPIEIYKTRNKKYRVNDGNSTFAVAKKNGWETIYATVVPNPNVKARVEKSTFTIAKEIRKEGESWADAVQRVKNMRK